MNKASFSDWITKISGQKPVEEKIYVRAVTHGSFGESDYQRLEFLGDRVLGLTIASYLFEHFPDEPEGKLSQRLNGLVSGKFCSEIAKEIGVSDHLRLGKQARDDGARQSAKVLGDVMESLIGAVYLDQGMEAAGSFILVYWKPHIVDAPDTQHPKSALQEWAASNNRKVPVYSLMEKSGPDHDLKFRVKVAINKVGEVEATASSIQAAETHAAQSFLEKYT